MQFIGYKTRIGRLVQLVTILALWIAPAGAQENKTNPLSQYAQWISPGYKEDSFFRPCPIFRKSFSTSKKIKSAILYITAHGLYEAQINSKRVGDAYFTPGWTSYDKRLQYQQYTITNLIKSGTNLMDVTIGDGWYRGIFGGDMKANRYGSDASLLCQLQINYTDGTKAVVVSDSTWQSSTGPIRSSDIYQGEVYDGRIRPDGWTGVAVRAFSKNNLIPTVGEPIRKLETFKPKKIFTAPNGDHLIDFGQNISGWVRFKVKGKPGDTITISHAETLDKDGNFYISNLRDAKATDMYILKGKAEETFEPHFTYHGFRYVKLLGCKAIKENFLAIALHSALGHTGSFACSDPTINQLQSNIAWSLDDNFFDVPTDCPQRSERLGWTGDAQIFCRTAAFNRNVKKFFVKWLGDLKTNQGVNGGMPNIIPDLYNFSVVNKGGAAGWGDAATIVPWTLFEAYNDTAILRAQYSGMKAWVDYIKQSSKNFLWAANGYGDWYAPGPPTDIPFIDQCFWAHSTELLIKTAGVLGKADDKANYTEQLQKIKQAFLDNYLDSSGRTRPNTQTSYVLALEFDLVPDSLQTKAIQKLVSLIHDINDHLATGFLGTPYLLHVLSKFGYSDLAYTLLEQKTSPSWLYPITKGATTIWEKWDAIREDGSFDTCSLNHYAYGAVGDWLYQVVAGINAGAPGYKEIRIEPLIGGGLSWVKASYVCPFGKIISDWKVEDHKLKVHIVIPPGTKAVIVLPGRQPFEVAPGVYFFETAR